FFDRDFVKLCFFRYRCFDEFLKKRTNISAETTIYSVVDTLAELSNINKVQFSINGEQVLLYNDTIDFGSAFERNLDIVDQE
ncbi:GerMN domain-containing protein, partial [Jutongia sp.]|uniref:GerMN domain-containing protein n=1 Tax=Jutongia sp. TaxID=2944204 RepID=UPI003078F337